MTTYILLSHLLVSHEFLQLLKVLMRIECDAFSLAAITSGTTSLLIIALKALWYVIMYDEAYIWLVDTHTECYRGYDDIDIFHQEIILCLAPYDCIETGMVRRRFYIVGNKYSRQFFHLFSGKTIDDTALSCLCLDEFHYLLIHGIGLRTHFIVEVWTIE